jgi:hypothetical protein
MNTLVPETTEKPVRAEKTAAPAFTDVSFFPRDANP